MCSLSPRLIRAFLVLSASVIAPIGVFAQEMNSNEEPATTNKQPSTDSSPFGSSGREMNSNEEPAPTDKQQSTSNQFSNAYAKTVHDALGDGATATSEQQFWKTAHATVFGPRHHDPDAVSQASDILEKGKDFPTVTEDFKNTTVLPSFHAGTLAGEKMKADLRELLDNLKSKGALDSNDLKNLTDKTAPFLRTAEMGQLAQTATVIIPPGQTIILHTPTFCLEHDVPAPAANEPHSLIPSSLLIPAAAKDIYDSLVAYAPAHPADNCIIQTLFWAIRHIDTIQPPEPPADEKRVLDAALGDGAQKYEDFIHAEAKNKNAKNSAPKQLNDDGRLEFNTAASQIAGNNLTNAGIVQHTGDISNPADTTSIIAQLIQARVAQMQASSTQPTLTNGQGSAQNSPESPATATANGATLLAPGVAATAKPDSGLSGVTVQITNASDTPYAFHSNQFVALNDNSNTQPLVISGASTTNYTPADIQAAKDFLRANSNDEIATNWDSSYQFDPARFVAMARQTAQPAYITPPATDDTTITNLPPITRTEASAPSDISELNARLANRLLDYARLSKATYDNDFTSLNGWHNIMPVTPVQSDLAALFLPTAQSGITAINTITAQSTPAQSVPSKNFYAAAFRNGQEIVIAFRGTANSGNWVTDAKEFLGRPLNELPEFEQALDFVRQVLNNPPAGITKITLVGHSLGGGLASFVTLALTPPRNSCGLFPLDAVVFNSSGIGRSLRANVSENLPRQNSLITNIDIVGDPVSALGQQVGQTYRLNAPKNIIDSVNVTSQGDGVATGVDNIVNPLFTYHKIETVIAALQLSLGTSQP
jgi:hypothetical protein